jgi:L-ribulose-5-phosphate 3-epimerase
MPRIVSCYSNSYGPSGVRSAVEKLGIAGLEFVELALRGHDYGGLVIPESVVITERAEAREVDEFRAFLELHQIQVSGCNVGGADIRTVEGFELTARRLEFAGRAFGAPLAVSGAGQPTNESERRLVVERLKYLGNLAGSLNMDLTLETHKGPTQNARSMLELMAEVDHPQVRINFDTGNIAYYNEGVDPVDELEQVKHLVRSVHLKDNRGKFEDWYFPPLGDGGAVDFVRVREILDAVGFAGPYTIELEGIGGEPEPGLETRHERVERSIQHLRECGYFD